MAMSTILKNLTYANLGNVTVHFDDSTSQTININGLGRFVFDSNSHRIPVYVTWNSHDFYLTQMPIPITYPNSTPGSIGIAPPIMVVDQGTNPPNLEWPMYMDTTGTMWPPN